MKNAITSHNLPQTKKDYKSFIARLVKGAIKTEEVVIDENTKQMNVYSKKTDKLLCAREYCSLEDVSEKYKRQCFCC